ncbi:Ras-related protein Rab-7L1 [Geodia barretti]|uniref:Ras-related protein Rab-7L1 n=1 Tax=Geodia barretti TaxID=519541 RepID=A0AA35T4T1_GEOBA|nr:Ras-related protein Rab-7L1 [Geodia barretti]
MSEASHKKVIVIGDGHVGKTCFVAKVTENKFIPNYLPTMGVEFGVKSIRRGNHDVKLKVQTKCFLRAPDTVTITSRPSPHRQCGDIGRALEKYILRQERFNSLMPQFCRGAAVAIVMCDVTQPATLQSTKMWKQLVDKNVLQPNGQSIPAVLLINKFDLPKQRQLISVEAIQEVARECSFVRQYQISVKDSTNILEALEFVAELAERYEDEERTYLDTAALSLPTMYSEHRKRQMNCCTGGGNT